MIMVMINVYKCLRCEHEWAGRLNREPKVCPKCKSPYWNTPKVKQSGPRRKERCILIPGKPSYKQIILQTRLGNPIDNCQDVDFSINQQIPDYAHSMMGIKMRNSPNPYYNCHGLTFASSRTKVFPESIQMILDDDGYTQVEACDALPGDVVLYYDKQGEISHSGVIITESSEEGYGYPWVVSKWGVLNEVCHLAYDIPKEYQPFSKLSYWRITRC